MSIINTDDDKNQFPFEINDIDRIKNKKLLELFDGK